MWAEGGGGEAQRSDADCNVVSLSLQVEYPFHDAKPERIEVGFGASGRGSNPGLLGGQCSLAQQ